jgi:hypothetical protein
MNMKRLKIKETQELDLDLERSIDNLINYLNVLKADGWEEIGYGYDYDNQIVAYRMRLETDDEFERRKKLIDKEKERKKILKQKKKDRDLKEYLRLKAKFEREVIKGD